jgi:GT2 family glycosyltransferase
MHWVLWGIVERDCDISVVITSWNARRFLRKCLNSLGIGTKKLSCEIIVVDNASSDGSLEMVRDEFPEVRLVAMEKNVGFARANNVGINESRGRYLCLVNSDVEVFDDTVGNLFDYMEAHREIGMLGPRVLNSDMSRQASCRRFPDLKSSFFRALKLDTTFPRSRMFGRHHMTDWNYDDIRGVDILSGCFWTIRRKALFEVGLLDERFFFYGEDMDFCRRFHQHGWKVVFYPEAKIIHYGGGSSMNDPERFWVEMQRANLQYFLKHYGRFKSFIYFNCLIVHNFVRLLGFSIGRAVGLSSDVSERKLSACVRGLRWLLSGSTIGNVLFGSLEGWNVYAK